MKALLICPTGRPAVSLLCDSGPLATTPILGDCLIGYWIEHLAALGAKHIQVIAAERADDVRETVGDGARWGVRITVTASDVEPTLQEAADRYRPAGETEWLPKPNDIIAMSHLPGCPSLPLFRSYANWFAALAAWVPLARTPARVRITQVRPGIWVGSRSQVSALAQLIAPCWIGDRATVSAGAIVGPGAILEDRSVADSTARITQSWVGPDTLVGRMTSVANSLAWGSTLIDWRSDSLLHVPDPFLLSSLARPKSPATTDQFGRALAHKIPSQQKLSSIMALDATIRKSSDLNVPA